MSKHGLGLAMSAHVYILRCAGGAYYVGSAQHGLELRLAEHNAGSYDGWTARRRPVALVFSQEFESITDALAAERKLKGWSRAKKEALIRGDFAALPALSGSAYRRRRGTRSRHPTTRPPAAPYSG